MAFHDLRLSLQNCDPSELIKAVFPLKLGGLEIEIDHTYNLAGKL